MFRSILYLSEGTVAEDASIMRAASLAENNQADLTIIDVVPAITAGIGARRGDSMDRERQESMSTSVAKNLQRWSNLTSNISVSR